MKKLVINKLLLSQFQRFDSLQVNFGEQVTDISGDNGTGKTTIYSALTWLLFGKDSLGREKFDIKRIVNGEKQDRVDVSVEGFFELHDDHVFKSISLKRVLSEKWDEKSDTYKGDETKCYVDGVPYLVGEYQKYVSDIVCEDDFRILTSVTHFLGLKMDEQRSYLCKMAGIRDAREVASENPSWEKAINEMPATMVLDDFIKLKKDALKALKDEKKGFQPSINALTASMPTEQNWVELEDRKKYLDEQIESINESISSSEEKDKVEMDRRISINRKVNDIRFQQQQKQAELRLALANCERQMKDKVEEENRQYIEAERSILNAQKSLDSLSKERTSEQVKLERLDAELTELFNRYNAENQRQFISGEQLMCPLAKNLVCGTSEAMNKYKEEQEVLREKFNERKIEVLNAIKAEGKAKRQEFKDCEERINKLSMDISDKVAELDRLHTAFYLLHRSSMPTEIPGQEELKKEFEEYMKSSNEEVALLEASVRDTNTDHSVEVLKSQRRDYFQELSEVIKKLSDRDQIARVREQIDIVSSRAKSVSNNITICENLIDSLTEIKRAVVDDAAIRINSLFQVTTWVTSVQQKNGDWKDTCIPTIDGVSASLNYASRINVGLDIINVIGKFLGISVPIFIDNRESINSIVDMAGTQIINLRVAPKGTPLTIN